MIPAMKPIILALSLACCAAAAPVKLVEEAPVSVTTATPNGGIRLAAQSCGFTRIPCLPHFLPR